MPWYPPRHRPGPVAVVYDLGAEALHDRAGHVDIWPRDRVGSQPYSQRVDGPGEHQSGDELARGVTGHRCVVGRDRSGDARRETVGDAELSNRDTHCSERSELVAHRAVAHLFMGIDNDRRIAERRQRDGEAGGGTGLVGGNVGFKARQLTSAAVNLDGRSRPVNPSDDAETIKHAEHRLGVVGEQCATKHARAVGESRAHQCPISDALGAGERHRGVGWFGQRCDRMWVGEVHASSACDEGRYPSAIRPPWNRSAMAVSMSNTTTPRGPSVEWAISRS